VLAVAMIPPSGDISTAFALCDPRSQPITYPNEILLCIPAAFP
jgi:hypothetical protein